MTLDEKIKNRLFNTFKIEAKEHILNISNKLLQFEKEDDQSTKKTLIEEIFRAAHSLKGAARAVGLNDIKDACQKLEDVFSSLKKTELKEVKEIFSLSINLVQLISKYIIEEDENNKFLILDEIDAIQIELANLYQTNLLTQKEIDNKKISAGEPNKEKQTNGIKKAKRTQTKSKPKNKENKTSASISRVSSSEIADQIRISISKLENILTQSEELLPNKLSISNTVKQIQSIEQKIEDWKISWGESKIAMLKLSNDSSFIGGTQKNKNAIETINNFFSFNENFVLDTAKSLHMLLLLSQKNYDDFNNKLFQLNSNIRSTLMLPVNTLTNQFPVMMREIADSLNKKIDFTIKGDSLELDKRILESLKDPLVHLLRNSIDHGIETPEERSANGKNDTGKITLSFKMDSSNSATIILEDDGNGIDTETIKEKAISKNIITAKELETLSKEKLLGLIFESELSTSKVITDLSGRGLGMAIVKEKVTNVGGTISISSEIGKGTKFIMKLPLSISTVRGLFIKSGDHQFIIKNSDILSSVRTNRKSLISNENNISFDYQGKQIGIVTLSNILNIQSENNSDFVKILICGEEDNLLGIIIDEIIDEQELLIKQFNKQIKKLKFYEGASVNSSGDIIPILNIKDIIQHVSLDKRLRESTEKTDSTPNREYSLLVVDDSITSRLLLKDILETSDYTVTTAVDGSDAWIKLKQNHFDLVVSDVEMPKMNGFELTKTIKTNEEFSNLPVVLVTSLSRKEDIEKGINAGANAYIVKGDFEQSNLLDTIRRLLQ